MKTPEYRDFPFDEVLAKAEKLAAEGAHVFQKFTCVGCGQRLTIDIPNVFHRTGSCDKCGYVTNIRARGCNYMIIQGELPASLKPKRH